MSVSQSGMVGLVEKGWKLADAGQHPLGALQGKRLGAHLLAVFLGPANRVGAKYFQLFLRNTAGDFSIQPLVIGLYSQGSYPSYNWIEISYFRSRVRFGDGSQVVYIAANDLTQQLFQYLADLIPSGGHMMVEYDSPEQQETARSLALGIPPVATPLGYVLFLAGCGAGFRDWYFAEGGSEGPRKLQGFKALDKQHALIKAEETTKELSDFLDQTNSKVGSALEAEARERAIAILTILKNTEDGTSRRVDFRSSGGV